MKHNKEWYTCDKCGEEMNANLFKSGWRSKIRLSATIYEKYRYGYLPEDILPQENTDSVTIEGVFGYGSKFKQIHLCNKCGKKFKEFIKNEKTV